jgi:hypothetical protein
LFDEKVNICLFLSHEPEEDGGSTGQWVANGEETEKESGKARADGKRRRGAVQERRSSTCPISSGVEASRMVAADMGVGVAETAGEAVAVPEDTTRVARQAFANGNLYIQMRDASGVPIWADITNRLCFPGVALQPNTALMASR